MQKQGYSKVPVFENGLAQPVFHLQMEKQEKIMILIHRRS